MIELSGQSQSPFLIVHGGAGPMDPDSDRLKHATHQLKKITAKASQKLGRYSPIEVAQFAVALMEDDETFNAGYGSALQSDGIIRQTASAMESTAEKLSGVISIEDILHPSALALRLQSEEALVLTTPGSVQLAEEMNLETKDLKTNHRIQQYEKSRKSGGDTVGCVVFQDGQLAAVTSTGGRGFETPGRVSDSATVAGNYATRHLSVCATGIGEQIVNDAVCARIETRVRDGLTLQEASKRQLDEAREKTHFYAWIAIDKNGYWSVAGSSPSMSFVVAGDQTLASS